MTPDDVDAEDRDDFFRRALTILNDSGVPFLVGGAYALERYTGVARQTKDIDVFVRPRDCRRLLAVLARAGYGLERLCRGTLLSRYQYLVDLQLWNYQDARLLVPRPEAA